MSRRSFFRYPLLFLLGFTGLVVVYVLFAVLFTLIPANLFRKQSTGTYTMYLISNKVHTDLCFPMNDGKHNWAKQFPEYAEYAWLSFGWGDREFYTTTPEWSDLRFGTAMRALFWPTPALVHVTGYRNTPTEGKLVRKLKLGPESYTQLQAYVLHTLVCDSTGNPLNVQSGYYEARGKYHMFFTCNNWTNRGLRRAGLRTALWAPFDKCVLYHF